MIDGNWRLNKSPSTRNEYRRFWFQKVRHETIVMLGAFCQSCGFSDIRALEVDHINGDGSVDRRAKRGTSYYYHIQKTMDSGRYQVLCANCNVIKRRVKQECPLQGRDGPNSDQLLPMAQA